MLAAVGDVDRDGITDFAAGAPYDDALGGSDAGSVVLFSGADGTKLRKLADPGGAGYDYLGVSVAGIGDVDGDLVPDVVAGAYYDSTPQGSYAGSVALFSGASGALIRKLTDPAGAANDRLGTAVAALPDVNGDGIPEVVAGAPQNDAAATDAGRVVVFSGADGAVLQRFTDPAALGTDLLGTALAAIGDLGGGGKPEILAGAEGAPLPEGQDAGKVLVFSFEADCDGDGVTALLDCDDGDGAVEPGAPERCNAVDDDCDGLVDEDDDGDGYAACAGDCDNGDPRVFPGAPERCNAADDDCDGSTRRRSRRRRRRGDGALRLRRRTQRRPPRGDGVLQQPRRRLRRGGRRGNGHDDDGAGRGRSGSGGLRAVRPRAGGGGGRRRRRRRGFRGRGLPGRPGRLHRPWQRRAVLGCDARAACAGRSIRTVRPTTSSAGRWRRSGT